MALWHLLLGMVVSSLKGLASLCHPRARDLHPPAIPRGSGPAAAFLWALCLAVLVFSPAGATSERIERFHSLVRVLPDASLEVTETITVMALGDQIKRGIVREFPTIYHDRRGLLVKVGFDIRRITRDGKSESYHTKKVSNGVAIYIGRSETMIPHGRHTYAITYRTTRQLGYFADYDELYWNVTGNDWRLPIDQAEALVEAPPGGKVLKTAAYTGPSGAKGKDFKESRPSPGAAYFVTTRPLPPGQGLTVAVAWPKGLVARPSQWEAILADNSGAVYGGLGLAVVLLYYLVAWFMVGRDPKRGTIIPLFKPPAGMSPAAVRYITRMGYDAKTLAVALVDMAVKGFLTIIQDGQSYALSRGQASDQALAPGERKAGARLFAGQRVSLKLKQGNHTKFQAVSEALKQSLDGEYSKAYFVKNAVYFAPGFLLSLLALVAMCWDGDEAVVGMTIWVTMWTTGCLVLLVVVARAWQAVSPGPEGWFKRSRGALVMTGFASLFWASELLGLYLHLTESGFWTTLVLLAILGVNPLFLYLLRAPTRLGRKVLDQIEGFKLYLSVAEEERLNMLNPPQRTPQLFERYLPYAMALDVEQQWGQRFQQVLAEAGQEPGGYSPSWFRGDSWSAARVGAFADGLSGGFTSAIASSSSAPGSSSGSGGGGSSGGGGGGGGGGGW